MNLYEAMLSSANWAKIFRQEVGKHKHPRSALGAIRNTLRAPSPRPLFDAMRTNNMFRAAVASNAFPREFSQLWGARRLGSWGLVADLHWEAEVLSLFVHELTAFRKAEKRFEDAYILAEYNSCLAILDELEEQIGLSLWLISRRITVLRKAGFSDNDYANQLIAEASDGTLMSWLIFMLSYRADSNTTPSTYMRTIENSLKNSQLPASIIGFMRYHCLSLPPRSHSDCVQILAASEIAPIIDRFVAFLDAAQFVVTAYPDGSEERSAVGALSARISIAVGDDRFSMLSEICDRGSTSQLAARADASAADFYTEGDYDSAVIAISSELRTNPGRTGLYSLLSRASLRASVKPEVAPSIDSIVSSMAAIQIFSSSEESSLIELSREGLAGAHRPLASSIRALFGARSEDPSEAGEDAIVESLNGDRLTPLQLRRLPTDRRIDIITKALEINSGSTSLDLQAAVLRFGQEELPASLAERLPADRETLYRARGLLRLSRESEAVDLLEGLESNEVTAVANDARRTLFNAFIASGRNDEALRLVARAYRQNERLHAIFRLRPLLDAVEQSGSAPPFEEISLAICYHIFNRFAVERRDGAQADAAEEYVASKGVQLPSELDDATLGEDRDLLPIFLDQVCVPVILDKFMAIENVDQVETERLGICRVLSEIDPSNRQQYLDEIRDITRRRVVRDRFEQVERTKIYVDTDGVRRQAEKNLRDSYLRFTAALAVEGTASGRLEMVRLVQQILSEVKTDGVKVHFPDLPANEADQIFGRLLRDITALLVSSQEYGLEAYLSTRVRHGTMGNQLRSAYELQSLLTQREGKDYQPDKHWAEILDLDSFSGEWLAKRLAIFSADLDAQIEDLVRQRVQVRSEASPQGLFIFPAYNYDIIRLQSEISPETSFEVFMDKAIEQFWTVLELTLTHVRAYIEQDFVALVHQLTETLEKDISSELRDANISPLRDALAAARTQMAVNVANVAAWFTLARDLERPDYEFGVAVEVASESIRVCHPSLSVDLRRTDDVTFDCRGRTLESLVYMLFTALDNALEHCGFKDRAPALTLKTSLQDGWLELQLINTCAQVFDVDAENVRLNALHNRLESGNEVQGLATTEGGSGYAKIIRILRHELLARYSLDFGYRSATEYAVTIGMDAKAIVK